MIEFRNQYGTVKLTINCSVNRYEDIDLDLMEIIVNISGSNNYKWRITDSPLKSSTVLNYELFRRKYEL